MIVQPTKADELSQILRDAEWAGDRVAISGGGTRLSYGNVCEPTDINISLSTMNQIIDYTPDDLVIAVGAGCTIEQVNAVLDEHDQWLPVAAAHPDRSTIGGAFASGIGGPIRRLRGSLKDLVIGVEVVLADGTIAKSGGMVVKNVSGYDLTKLYAGSLGAFGIVTRLNLKVYPRPQSCRELVVRSSDSDLIFEFIQYLLLHAGEGGEYFLRWRDGVWRLHFRQFGAAAVVISVVDQLASRAEQCQLDATINERVVGTTSLFEEVIDFLGPRGIVRVGAGFDQHLSTSDSLVEAGCDTVFVDPAGGLVYGLGSPSCEWRDAILDRFADPTFLSLPQDMKAGFDVFGPLSSPAETVTRRLKDEFDPNRRLNPGRYLLGL